MEKELLREFKLMKGKTIALVYIFEGDNNAGFNHFFVWKSNIISLWLNAIQSIECFPLILDVRTFVEKALNRTLPDIDFVLNLNSGTYDLSAMALVPAVCSSIGVPCIPCDATTIVTGENKLLSNLIANSIGLNVPQTYDSSVQNGIFRPISLGNSMGVKRSYNNATAGIYQEFIEGYDVTTPIVYNAARKKMEVMPTVIYIPESNDVSWYNGENEKRTRSGYNFKTVTIDDELINNYTKLLEALSIKTFCRIDARVKSLNIDSNINHIKNNNTYFVEINVMPTIREYNNFVFSYDSIDKHNSFFDVKEIFEECFGKISLNSFLLMSSMLAIKTKY